MEEIRQEIEEEGFLSGGSDEPRPPVRTHKHWGEDGDMFQWQRPLAVISLVWLVVAVLAAHDGMDHVRGVVTEKTDYGFTLRTDQKTLVVLTITSQTTVRKNGRSAGPKDLKVNDRVFVEVPQGSTIAAEIEIETINKQSGRTRWQRVDIR
jgi:hypothetical protein